MMGVPVGAREASADTAKGLHPPSRDEVAATLVDSP